MSPGTSPATRPAPSGDRQPPTDQFRLLRYSHIFASVVREVLEVQLLAEVASDPLTLHQFHLLKLLSANGRHQMGEVAEFLGVSAPAATKNIDKLERLKLVARIPSEDDRRATLLTASTRGRRLVERYEELKTERLAPVFEAFSAEELEQLTRLLERFSLSLIKMEATEDGGLCLRCSAYYDDHCPVQHLQEGCPYQAVRRTRVAGAPAPEP